MKTRTNNTKRLHRKDFAVLCGFFTAKGDVACHDELENRSVINTKTKKEIII